MLSFGTFFVLERFLPVVRINLTYVSVVMSQDS